VQRLHSFAQATVFIFQRLQVLARKWHPAARRHRASRGPATEPPDLGGAGYGATAPPGWLGPRDGPLASSGASSRPVTVARRGWAARAAAAKAKESAASAAATKLPGGDGGERGKWGGGHWRGDKSRRGEGQGGGKGGGEGQGSEER
jgi:hypothetical protein